MLTVSAWAESMPDASSQTTPKPVPLKLDWDARLRHEQVDDAAFSKHAQADTLRVRLGLHAALGHGWSGLFEGAGVASAGNRYNSGSNGQIQYPAVIDPRGGELNQAWLRWQGAQVTVTLGRQRLLLDNQRWVGNVGWRQHEQTYDAFALQWQPLADLTVRYDWLDRVHRVFGNDALNPLARQRRLDTHLFNAAYVRGTQTWVGYAYLHEDRDVTSASSATYGLRWKGNALHEGNGPGWTLEAARQYSYANNPLYFSYSYWLLEPSWTRQGITAKLGWEHLGGDGSHALQTPLATLHAFNGWDDQFLVTPAGGLNDRYASLGGKLGREGSASRLGWTLAYHDFHADRGGHYGSEWDASIGFPVAAGIRGLLKVADYRASGFGHDDTKLWLQFEWRGQQAL